MLVSEKIYTLEEFDEYVVEHPDTILELIDGRIVEKLTTEKDGKIFINIGGELSAWQKKNRHQGTLQHRANAAPTR
jgi:Uma2 family endonuclease